MKNEEWAAHNQRNLIRHFSFFIKSWNVSTAILNSSATTAPRAANRQARSDSPSRKH